MIIDIKKQAVDYGIIATSYHESSHALCSLFNFIKVSNVHTSSETINEGNTDYILFDCDHINDDELFRVLVIQELQAIYGGLVGEKIYYKEICGSDKFPMHLRIGSSSDMATASAIIRKYNLASPGKQTAFLKKQIQTDANVILKEHWNAVKIIAHNLYKKRRLSFDELKFLLTRKTDNKDFWKERFKLIKMMHNSSPLEDSILKKIVFEHSIINS